ncbi:MAG: sialidase family protein, partial [Leptolyngbyaceae bacterium]|nr:sialidase family protein [Leptolyngbyaceae bacterium]
VAYDVRRSSGTVTVIDRRHANIWRPIDGRTRGWALVPHNYYSNSASGADGPDDVTLTVRPRDIEVVTGAGAARPCLALSMVPCRTGSHLSGLAADVPTGAMIGILWDNGTNRNVLVKHFTVAEVGADPYLDIGNWDDPDNGSAVNVVTAAGIQDMCLLALPSARGNTHLCLYIDTNGDLFGKFSTDNGGSWGSQFTVWAPSSTDTVSRVSAVLTRMGRIVVACAYNTGNRIRYIYSDDYGNNWLTNTNAGFSSTATGVEAVDLSIVEDDRGNLWTVAAVAATNGLRLYRGQAENNPVADTTEAASGWVVGPENDELSRIEAIAMPNGVIGVLHSMTEASGTTNQLNFIQVVRNHPVHHQPLVLAPVSNNTQNGVVVACTVGLMASGYLHVAYANPYTTSGGTVYNLEVRTHLYAPTEIPRIGAFFGGL